MKGKHALITGGGSGIGRAIAEQFAQAGAKVSILGRRPEPLAEVAANYPQQIVALPCDVTDQQAVNTTFEKAQAAQGAIDILVNNAGAAPTAPFHRLDSDDWHRVMQLNLNAVFYCCQAAYSGMRERGWGRIITIASTAAHKGYAYVSAYCAAKHGVLGLTRALALEAAGSGITVNAICPGYTDTDIVREGIANIVAKTGRTQEQALAEFTRSNPQGRLIQPNEVAQTALWLCSDGAASVTGQGISISGGEVM